MNGAVPSPEQTLPERWLHLLCSTTPGANRAVAVLDASEESAPFGWPDPASTLAKAHVAEARRVAASGKPSLRPQTSRRDDQLFDTIAVPLLRKNQPTGGLAVDLPHRPATTQQAVIQHLLCGAAWLDLLLSSGESRVSGAKDILELLALTTDTQDLTPSLVRFVTELAVRRGLSRASLGFNERGRIELAAISHSAKFDPKSDIASALEQAMQETLAAGQSLAYPNDELPEGECAAHAFLLKDHGAGAVYSFGFASSEAAGEEAEAVLLVETPADRRLSPADRAFCEAAANTVGPVLAIRRRESRSLPQIARSRLARFARERLGPDRFGAKIAAAAGLLAIVIVWLPVPHRVSADAVLEGTVQRAV
ncbi:MAG: hypothetical protein HKP27_09875, partial [Myxococcales bacterium]|nr:hypothetical protein [Myxococcales bacterium]